MTLPRAIGLATAFFVLPSFSFASDSSSNAASPDTVFIFNSLLFLIGGFLVFWMAAGFAMLEAGLVRSKNVAMQLTKNMSLFAVAATLYYLFGYNLMYPLGQWLIDGFVSAAVGLAILEPVAVTRELADDYSYAATGSDFFFQLMFCATTASIVSGALAERIKLWPFLAFTVVLTGLIYPLQASWKWGGGFLDQAGFLDFAGSTVVHSVGGWAALTGALILGPRIGKYNGDKVMELPWSDLSLAALGTFILWLGWFGFNGASQLAMGTVGDISDISRIFANTNAAAAGGVLATLILSQILHDKPSLMVVLNGALGGLVAITAEPLYPSLGMATLIGGLGGTIVVFVTIGLDKLKIDDVVGAIPVHLACGVWGTLAVVFTNPDASILAQLYGIGAIGLFTVLTSALVWWLLSLTMGLRVGIETEIAGLDIAELSSEAFPEHLRQASNSPKQSTETPAEA
ncbi:MAG: ammonium transporter [Cognatishimia activa]